MENKECLNEIVNFVKLMTESLDEKIDNETNSDKKLYFHGYRQCLGDVKEFMEKF